MKRTYQKVLLSLFIVFFILLVAYAFVQPVRAWMQINLGPPITDTFSGLATTITTSSIWINHIIPFPNQAIIFGALIYIPLAILVHRNFNWVRTKAVRSAARESGSLVMTEPISAPSTPHVTVTQPKEEPEPAPAETPPPEPAAEA